jgi:hypothetical protein
MEQNNEDKYTPEENMLEKSTIYIFLTILKKKYNDTKGEYNFCGQYFSHFPLSLIYICLLHNYVSFCELVKKFDIN